MVKETKKLKLRLIFLRSEHNTTPNGLVTRKLYCSDACGDMRTYYEENGKWYRIGTRKDYYLDPELYTIIIKERSHKDDL